MSETDDAYRDWDASYVLGMLGPDDRRAFERHLATCESCTAAVAELAGLPGLLGALSAEEAVVLTTVPESGPRRDASDEPDLVQRLARHAVRRRRRTRIRVSALAVGAAAVLAVAAFFVGTSLAPAAPAATAMTEVMPGTMTANLSVTAMKWGTRLDWSCSYPKGPYPANSRFDYDLVVTDTAGTEIVVASWSASGARAKNLSASTRVATDDIRSVDIRPSGSATVLARTDL